MVKAAQAFIGCLGNREQACVAFDDADRTNWHYFPVELHERKGLCFNDMSSEQRLMAIGMMSTGLSNSGLRTALGIMSMEDEVHRIEHGKGRFHRHSGLYYLTIFGTPSLTSDWAWRVEGHHLSLNYTIRNGCLVSCTPAFFGANPKKVQNGTRNGYAVLGEHDDHAQQLLTLLAKNVAPLSEIPGDILTKAQTQVEVLEGGVTDLSDLQCEAVDRLVSSYLSIFPDSFSSLILDDQPDWDVAYVGQVELSVPHYYRVQSKGFLLEYCNSQPAAMHSHAVLRNAGLDFGSAH